MFAMQASQGILKQSINAIKHEVRWILARKVPNDFLHWHAMLLYRDRKS